MKPNLRIILKKKRKYENFCFAGVFIARKKGQSFVEKFSAF